MKCLNCGFESNNPFCPMCGAKTVEQDSPQAENSQNTNAEAVNPYLNNTQQEIPVYSQPNVPPQPPVYPQPNMPVPPQYAPPAQKKPSKALPIILTCIIIAVVIAGVVISICSSYMFNRSFFESLTKMDYTYEDDYYEPIIDDGYYEPIIDDSYNTYTDETIYVKGEIAKYDTFNLTLKDAKISELNFDDSMQMCSFTFEIENTTDESRTFYQPWAEFDFNSTKDAYSCTYEWLYDDIKLTDNGDLVLDAGEKVEFTMHYKISKDSTPSYTLVLNVTDATDLKVYDVYSSFTVDLTTED